MESNPKRSLRAKNIVHNSGTCLNQRRQSLRSIQTPKKYRDSSSSIDDNEAEKRKMIRPLSKSGKKENIENIQEDDLSNTSESSCDEKIETPSDVLFEGQDVSGKAIFGFKTKKRQGGFAQKIFEAVNSPRKSYNLNNSVKNSGTSSQALRKSMRQKMKENVAELDSDNSFEDFSESGSEYQGSGSESESSSEQEEEMSIDSDNDSDTKMSNSSKLKNKTVKTSKSQRDKVRNICVSSSSKNHNYVMKSDDYFSWQSSSRIVTSNHTLQKLKQPKLSENQLQELLASSNLNQTAEHEKAIHEMFKYSCSFFNKWMFVLHEGFSVLLYGLGSKRNILKAFHKDMLQCVPTIVVNGYFPSLTIKDITDSILLDIFEAKSSPGNIFEAVELIEKKCYKHRYTHFYIIVHNIDGPMLRNNKSQNVLSSLAEIPNLHLIASVDHINTPLIWDHHKMSKFNFTWWDTTSFLPYSDETSFESSMLVQKSGALALSSLGNVYQSLTKNSKGVFMLIVKFQLNNKAVKYYQGMPFKVLYSQCREHFLVSSDLALRTQLTEFLDHKLVRSKRTSDGNEHLVIPINISILQQFLDQHKT